MDENTKTLAARSTVFLRGMYLFSAQSFNIQEEEKGGMNYEHQ